MCSNSTYVLAFTHIILSNFLSKVSAILDGAMCHGLLPEGGSCGAGAALCRFANEQGINLIILGNRDLGDFQRYE